MDRYFIGIAPPADLAAKIAAVQERLYKPGLLLKPLDPHITLIHPNALSKLPSKEFIPLVKTLGQKLLPIDIKLDELRIFGGRVLHIGVESTDLMLLQEFIINLLPPAIAKEYYGNRPYAPHITIAQTLRGKKLPDELIRPYEKAMKPLLPDTFRVDTLTKYEWIEPRTFKPLAI